MKVKNILETKKRRGEILSLNIDDPVKEAVRLMVGNDTGSVAIYDEGKFIGMLTFREVLAELDKRGFGEAAAVRCGDIVDRDINCATPEDGVDQIRSIMTKNHVRYLPVMSDGQLSDIISFYDVARSLAKAADFENRLLKEYIRDWPASSPDDDDKADA